MEFLLLFVLYSIKKFFGALNPFLLSSSNDFKIPSQGLIFELTLKIENVNKSKSSELFKIDQIDSLYRLILIKYKNGDCPSLLVCAEYSGKKKINNFKNDIEQSRNSIIEFVHRGDELVECAKKIFHGYDEIYFYGVGTSTYWLGEYVLNDEIKKKVKVIDDNEFYFDKIVPSFHCTITKIEEVIQINKGVFFIGTSPVYRKIIVNKILKKVSGKYDIVFIEDNNFQVISNTLIQ